MKVFLKLNFKIANMGEYCTYMILNAKSLDHALKKAELAISKNYRSAYEFIESYAETLESFNERQKKLSVKTSSLYRHYTINAKSVPNKSIECFSLKTGENFLLG